MNTLIIDTYIYLANKTYVILLKFDAGQYAYQQIIDNKYEFFFIYILLVQYICFILFYYIIYIVKCGFL